MDYAILGLFRPLEESVAPPVLTVGTLCCFVVLLHCMSKFSFGFVHLHVMLPLLPGF
jgi:hypothetical protein